MILSWVWRSLSCAMQAPFKACIGWHDHPNPSQAPPSQQQCWDQLADVNSEAEFRWMHEQGDTLNGVHRDRVYDVLWILARHHRASLPYVENQLRALGYNYIWLYALPHDDGPDCPTECRDAETRETRRFSVGLVLGPESKALEVKRDVGLGATSLADCGFLELRSY